MAGITFSCHKGNEAYPMELVEADSAYMQGNPERGDYLIAAYQTRDITESEEVANYRKLVELEQMYMQSSLSLKELLTADSLCNYYGMRALTEQYAKALLFLGEVYHSVDDYPKAIEQVLKAKSVAEELESPRLQMIADRDLGDIYFDQRSLNNCIPYYTQYFDLASALHDTLRIAYGARSMGRVYTILNQIDSAIYYYQLSMSLGEELPQKDYIIPYAKFQLCDIYIQTEQFDKALELMPRNEQNDVNWAYLHYGQDHIDSAIYYFQKILGRYKWQGEVESLKILAELEEQRGDTKASLEYYRLLDEAKDSMRAQQKQAETRQVEARYNYERIKAERDRLEQRNKEQQRFIILLMVIVGIVGSAAWMAWHTLRQRRRANKARWQLVEKEKELEQTRQQADEPQRQREALLLELKGTAVYQRLKSPNPAMEKRVSEQEWQELATRLDDIYDHMSTRLRSLAKLSDTELRICYLLKLGVPPTDMAEILFKSKAAVTMARQRMYRKLTGRSARAEQFDQLLEELCP